MENTAENQLMYLAAWCYLKRMAKEQKIDKRIIDRLNRRNAETLMCDSLNRTCDKELKNCYAGCAIRR